MTSTSVFRTISSTLLCSGTIFADEEVVLRDSESAQFHFLLERQLRCSPTTDSCRRTGHLRRQLDEYRSRQFIEFGICARSASPRTSILGTKTAASDCEC